MKLTPRISVVCPLFNEEENIRLLYVAIKNVLDEFEENHEIIFVDDGSTDATAKIVRGIAKEDSRLGFLRFRRNYGQTPAMAAGIDHARGEIIVTMDGDLQNDPSDIPELVSHIAEDVDIVVGWRVNRQDKFLSRKVPSLIANRIIGRVTGVPIKDNGCSLKAYKAELIKQVPLYSELHRFIPAMASITGARVKQIPVRHHARKFGESKYGLGRIYRVLFDLLIVKTVTRFAPRPLVGFAVLAVPAAAVSLVLIVTITMLLARSDATLVVWTAVLVQFFGLGVFMVSCGAIGELVLRDNQAQAHRLTLLTSVFRRSSGSSCATRDQK